MRDWIALSALVLASCATTEEGSSANLAGSGEAVFDRIVDRFDFSDGGHLEVRTNAYRTAIYDVADFDGKTPVQWRIVVESADPLYFSAGDFDIFDPLFVGWYTGP